MGRLCGKHDPPRATIFHCCRINILQLLVSVLYPPENNPQILLIWIGTGASGSRATRSPLATFGCSSCYSSYSTSDLDNSLRLFHQMSSLQACLYLVSSHSLLPSVVLSFRTPPCHTSGSPGCIGLLHSTIYWKGLLVSLHIMSPSAVLRVKKPSSVLHLA